MDRTRMARLESRSLLVGMAANLFMGAVGVAAAVLSNSTAILVDGLFSLIGFLAAYLGQRISRRVDAGPDRIRPLGYAADEALFTTFRALSLLGLVVFAVATSAMQIHDHLTGAQGPELRFAPMLAYFAVIGTTCLLLWGWQRYAWIRTGRKSDILRLESKAALFDGLMTASAGLGLGAIYLFRDGFLAPVAPVGDSIVVMGLCLLVLGQYRRDLMQGLSELAGATAEPKTIATARRALRAALADDGGTLVDLSVIKVGRSHVVTVYYDPGRLVRAREVDALNLRLIADIQPELPGADVIVFVTEHPRRWPDALVPA
ncbi:cation transporter [Stappia sp.]|uniref:cation transporter n=1 Tax=Stappia sp. TaxID=1870903 RepID=UPI0032D92885